MSLTLTRPGIRLRRTAAGALTAALATTSLALVPGPAQADPVQGSVTVSETTFNPNGSRTVTVTGTGFNDPSALGTRAPFAGKQAGAYVAFGKAAEVWQPSLNADAATRSFGGGATDTSIRWALQQAEYDFLGGSGAVLLSPTGSFTATITIDKAAADLTAATKPLATNYGIYTYAGSGAKAASYETFTPITFTKYASTPVVAAAATTAYGKPVTVTATVPAVKGVVPTGNVVLSGAGTQTKALVGGKATFTLPANLSVAKRTLSITYQGDASYTAQTTTKTLTVTKDTVTISDKVAKKPTTKKSGKVTITVKAKSSKIKPTGKVTVYFKKSGQKTVKTSAGSLKNGVKSVTVPKLKKKGTWKIYVKYSAGSGYNSVSSKYVGTVKVTK